MAHWGYGWGPINSHHSILSASYQHLTLLVLLSTGIFAGSSVQPRISLLYLLRQFALTGPSNISVKQSSHGDNITLQNNFHLWDRFFFLGCHYFLFTVLQHCSHCEEKWDFKVPFSYVPGASAASIDFLSVSALLYLNMKLYRNRTAWLSKDNTQSDRRIQLHYCVKGNCCSLSSSWWL